MKIKKSPLGAFVIAGIALLLGVAIYSFARVNPPKMLTPVHAVHADLATYTGLWGSAPSLFYTLAMCLIVGACTSTRLSAKIHCYIWIVLALGLELSQHSMVAERISRLLESVLTGHMWSLFGPYWIRGVFDPLDLLATVLGGAIGLVLLSRLSLENTGVGSP